MLPTSLLARNGHPSHHRHKAIAVLHAYFDETGVHNSSPATLVAGLVAAFDDWDSFDVDWRKQLSVPNVPYFRAVDCEHGDDPFFGIDRAIRDSLIWGLADTIGKHKPFVTIAGISRNDWNNPTFSGTREKFENPYHICFAHCLSMLTNWSEQHVNGEPIALVFSDQSKYKNHAEVIFNAYRKAKGESSRFISLQFADMRTFPGLQAADLICYESYRKTLRKMK